MMCYFMSLCFTFLYCNPAVLHILSDAGPDPSTDKCKSPILTYLLVLLVNKDILNVLNASIVDLIIICVICVMYSQFSLFI